MVKLFPLKNDRIESASLGLLDLGKRDAAREADSGEKWCLWTNRSYNLGLGLSVLTLEVEKKWNAEEKGTFELQRDELGLRHKRERGFENKQEILLRAIAIMLM